MVASQVEKAFKHDRVTHCCLQQCTEVLGQNDVCGSHCLNCRTLAHGRKLSKGKIVSINLQEIWCVARSAASSKAAACACKCSIDCSSRQRWWMVTDNCIAKMVLAPAGVRSAMCVRGSNLLRQQPSASNKTFLVAKQTETRTCRTSDI